MCDIYQSGFSIRAGSPSIHMSVRLSVCLSQLHCMFGVQRAGSQCQRQRAISQLTMTTETVLRSSTSQTYCHVQQRQRAMLQLTMPTEIVVRSQRAGSQCQRQRAISQLTMTTETVLRSPTSQTYRSVTLQKPPCCSTVDAVAMWYAGDSVEYCGSPSLLLLSD